MMRMIRLCRQIVVILLLCLGLASGALAGTPAEGWDGLLEVTYKFSWYPRQDLQKLLEMKTAEYGQSLDEYRNELLREITGGSAPARIDPAEFRTGLPWRKYYRLSLADFCLYLVTDRPQHMENAAATLSVLAKKTGQPEIEFWNYVYGAHQACQKRDRAAFISEIYRMWQNVVLRYELESLVFPSDTAQTGFVRSLPYLYENVAHLVIRKAILEAEISDLYPLATVIQDIQPKLTLENGHKEMAAQIVERMRGVNSDNGNLNFAVALLEATATRYDFEDEKDEGRLGAKYNQVRKYYQLASNWADTSKGKTSVLTQNMGFMNYVLRRFADRRDLLLGKSFFNNVPALANDNLEIAFAEFDRLARVCTRDENCRREGFEEKSLYLQSMHQLIDSGAKLSIVLSAFHRAGRGPKQEADIFPAVRPLQRYCATFATHAPRNSEVLPDNAYFLAAYAARELASLYREHTRYSTDDRASALAFAYQLQAAELFPLDLPGFLQLAFQSTLDGRVRDFVQHSSPLSARLRVSADAGAWASRYPGEFAPLVSLLPTVVPEVIDNAFVFLRHFPEGDASEEEVFAKTVLMAKALASSRAQGEDKIDQILDEIGRREEAKLMSAEEKERFGSYFELKSRLYASPDNPLHGFLRTLFNEIPYENHPYVGLLKNLQ